MGYYTEYSLSFIKNGDQSIIEHFRKENENAEYSIDEEGNPSECSKWYDCERDLTEFSLKYPKTIFLMEGMGEEPGDIWKMYVRNGKSFLTKAQMVFEKFDEKKLK